MTTHFSNLIHRRCPPQFPVRVEDLDVETVEDGGTSEPEGPGDDVDTETDDESVSDPVTR